MNDSVQFHSRVGDDGVLNVQLNLGEASARKDVVITVAPLKSNDLEGAHVEPLSWPEFIDRTYGSCATQGLERPAQGKFESREPIE